jgi:hypothetical protein
VKNKDKDETDSLINYLTGLPERSPMKILLPGSEYYSQLEKAQMAKAELIKAAEELDRADS